MAVSKEMAQRSLNTTFLPKAKNETEFELLDKLITVICTKSNSKANLNCRPTMVNLKFYQTEVAKFIHRGL